VNDAFALVTQIASLRVIPIIAFVPVKFGRLRSRNTPAAYLLDGIGVHLFSTALWLWNLCECANPQGTSAGDRIYRSVIA
jgi:hypothetical protein